jgi:hypothetical protein
MSTPRSIRFEPGVVSRLADYVARRPGLSGASVAARLVDEGLRMEEHPGVIFRDGPAGRRATLVGGPDVWEVIRVVRAARVAEPELSERELLDLVEVNSGLPPRQLRTAVDYWGAYPAEVDALVEHADRIEAAGLAATERTDALLRR